MIGLIFIFILFVMPLIRLLVMSITDEGTFSLIHFQSILNEASTWKMLHRTLLIVVGSTAIALSLGFLFAYIVAYTNIRAKAALQLFILAPFVIPSYIVTIAWTQFANILHINLYSTGGIIFVLGMSHFPLVYLFTLTTLRRIPRELELAVRTSGGNSWTVLRHVTFPLALPGIVGGGLLAFLTNLDNFGIPAFLGIPGNITVLSTAIYQEVVSFGPASFSRAATLSVILAIIAFIGFSLQTFLLRKNKFASETTTIDHEPRIYLKGIRKLTIEFLVWIIVLTLTIVPLFMMIRTSLIKAYGLPFKKENITLEHYRFLLFETDKLWSSIETSSTLAIGTAMLAIFVGTYIAYIRLRKPNTWTKMIEAMVTIPYALPGIVLALAMIFAWMEPLPGWNPNIYGSIMILFIAYFTRFLILQVKGSSIALSQVTVDLEEAASVSGASSFTKWRSILLPLILPGILAGALFVVLTIFTELTVSSILWSSGTETIGVLVFNYEQAGYTTYSTAFSVIILTFMVVTAGIVLTIGRWWQKNIGIDLKGRN